ncbi:MAG TPA: hypothetical protein VES20_01360 [Bryobacteraceae bacterium]|nr:hypothetical protein [Bryobacteraceae bacterium]
MPEPRPPMDPGEIWRNQPAERSPMPSPESLDDRARELFTTTRHELLTSVGAALFFLMLMHWKFDAPNLLVLITGILVAVWSAAMLYRYRDQIWPGRSPTAGVAAPAARFYREVLERRRDHLANGWLWHGPLALSLTVMGTILVRRVMPQPRRLIDAAPLLLLLIAWTVVRIQRRRRQAAALQREIEEIRAQE